VSGPTVWVVAGTRQTGRTVLFVEHSWAAGQLAGADGAVLWCFVGPDCSVIMAQCSTAEASPATQIAATAMGRNWSVSIRTARPRSITQGSLPRFSLQSLAPCGFP
jgi:hypothetical protein